MAARTVNIMFVPYGLLVRRTVNMLSLQISRPASMNQSKPPPHARHDMIGPPDKVSNLRPTVFHAPCDETPLEKEYRLKRDEVQNWNESFWANHNTKFFKEKEKFMSTRESKCEETPNSSSDEMSVFYKKFLDNHWTTHQSYNIQWYKKNVGLLLLAICVKFNKLTKKFVKSIS